MTLRNFRPWLLVIFLCLLSFGSLWHARPTPVFAQTIEALRSDMDFLRGRTEAALFFNIWDTNQGFGHNLSEDQFLEVCNSNDCSDLGANMGTPFKSSSEQYEKTRRVGMGWVLEIADASRPDSVVAALDEPDLNVIVRFGIGGTDGSGGIGFDRDPQKVISFLRSVASQRPNTVFYAIAGPNEPDHETWAYDIENPVPPAAPNCNLPPGAPSQASEDWYDCVAPRLADFMNAVCDADLPPNVRLLSPAFNMTSYTFQPLVQHMIDAGARLDSSCLTGIAGNIYPVGQSMQQTWADQNIDSIFSGLPIYITETGPWDTSEIPAPDGDISDREVRDQLGLEDEGIRDELYYTSPILGLMDEGARNYDVIRQSLVRQGYQAYCATPTYTINPVFEGAVQEFVDNVAAGLHSPAVLNVGSTQILDYTQARTPIFRDPERKRTLKADLEEYFGYKELEETTFSQAELNSAPINSLLSETQRCAQAAQTLYAQEEMCNKLMRPQECELFKRQVPGTDYQVRQLLDEYKSFARSSDHLDNCKQIVVGEGGNRLRTGMLTASLHLDRAYRIAFLVAAIAQKPELPGVMFNFFTPGFQEGDPFHEVVIIAFRIPDIGTNKGSIWQSETVTTANGTPLYDQVRRDDAGRRMPTTESGHTYWDDPMTLSRNVLIPRKMAETLDLEGSQERQAYRDIVAGSGGTGALITCLRGTPPFGIGSESCNDHLGYALASMINASWEHDQERVDCSLITSEQVNEIGDAAPLGADSDLTYFQMRYGDYILQNLWKSGNTGVDTAGADFNSVFVVSPDTWPLDGCAPGAQGQPASGDCTVLNFYLVYPMGYDLETLEDTMSRTFLTEDQYAVQAADPMIKDRFNVLDDNIEFNASTAEHQFIDYLDCEIDPITNIRVCPEKDFSVTNQSAQGPAQFFGARLGFWTHRIQKAFNRYDSLAHKYLRRCRTTEEFLLDQCGGPTVDATFEQPLFCERSKHKIIRDVTNKDAVRFTFLEGYVRNLIGRTPQDSKDKRTMSDERGRAIFFGEGGSEGPASCNLKLTMRMIDGLTLIQTGGGSIVANNPGNQLGCVGTQNAGGRLQLRRLPPDTTPPPPVHDDRWETAPVMQTVGDGAEINFDLRLTPGYYWIYHNMDVGNICVSNMTYTMHHTLGIDSPLTGETTGPLAGRGETNMGYVIDLTDSACAQGECIDMNFQPTMEGGGSVYKLDEAGNRVLDREIREIDEIEFWDNCRLVDFEGNPFTYQTKEFNNKCGGGRLGTCHSEGGCDEWQDYIDRLNRGEEHVRGYQLYLDLYGRRLSPPSGDNDQAKCTHTRTASNGGRHTPIFANTINVKQCSNYSPDLDSLRLFGKTLGSPDFEYWNGGNYDFQIPSRELWESITTASAKHSCDPYLMLAVAASESPGYTNHTVPNHVQALGVFQFIPGTWDLWQARQDFLPATSCEKIQPPTYTEESRAGLDFSTPTNIPAASDAACRLVLWTGMQRYYNNESEFVRAFSQRGDNSYGQVWNKHAPQARFVHRLWRWLVESMEDQPVPAPAHPICSS